MLTDTVALRARLEAARMREKEARAAAARITREMMAADRRTETQRLCTLGRAWLAWGERNEAFRGQGQKFLAGYITRDADRVVLVGTPYELPEAAVPSPVDGGHDGE